jgi:hypothetical protein
MGGVAMAGPARHHLASVKVLLIDGGHHLDHAACDDFLGRVGFPFGVGAARTGMAILAAVAQGCGKQAHGAHELVNGNALQYLDILEGCLGHLPRLRALSLRLRGPRLLLEVAEHAENHRGNEKG